MNKNSILLAMSALSVLSISACSYTRETVVERPRSAVVVQDPAPASPAYVVRTPDRDARGATQGADTPKSSATTAVGPDNRTPSTTTVVIPPNAPSGTYVVPAR